MILCRIIASSTHPDPAEVLPRRPLDEEMPLLDDVAHWESDRRTAVPLLHGHHIASGRKSGEKPRKSGNVTKECAPAVIELAADRGFDRSGGQVKYPN
ncbi:hypothetical protein JTE90_012143 [Oedothorax gibbosus]|uniref:Uncharacterized protein n=1 Tax=Oedothorax gibbosus TaxID=931172 RepID=A0AAV6ULX2_9ARAC|nr:hypothetical protein JTE90_012143 [Oedothorax gibbosus]